MESSVVADFIKNLRNRDRVPKNIQLAALKCGTLASIFDEQSSAIISESVCSGIDRDPSVAVLKGLVEFVERQAFIKGRDAGLPVCQTPRSDGFAAFPLQLSAKASEIARTNAFNEAVERFVWATWWDDPSIAHEIREVDLTNLIAGETPLLDAAQAVDISSVTEVRPSIRNSELAVVIYFVFVSGAGVVTGGACGPAKEIENTRYRALGELTRHAYALRKLKLEELLPVTFYEKRLAHFGSNFAGEKTARERLSARGNRELQIPDLLFDEEVPHTLSDLVVVHRCYFKEQPDFVGGKLERLCL